MELTMTNEALMPSTALLKEVLAYASSRTVGPALESARQGALRRVLPRTYSALAGWIAITVRWDIPYELNHCDVERSAEVEALLRGMPEVEVFFVLDERALRIRDGLPTSWREELRQVVRDHYNPPIDVD